MQTLVAATDVRALLGCTNFVRTFRAVLHGCGDSVDKKDNIERHALRAERDRRFQSADFIHCENAQNSQCCFRWSFWFRRQRSSCILPKQLQHLPK